MKYDTKNIKNITKIEDIKILSRRAKKFLSSEGIDTMQALTDYWNRYGEKGIKQIKGIGISTFNEIYNFLHTDHSRKNFNIIKNLVYSDTNIQNTPVENLKHFFSARTINSLKLANIHTLKELISFCDEYGIKELRKLKAIGLKVCYEIRMLVDPENDNSLNHVISELQNINVPKDVDDNEIYLLSGNQLTQTEQIKLLKSDIEKHKLAIVRTKAKIAQLKKARIINKQKEEPQR